VQTYADKTPYYEIFRWVEL